ncbi:MAG: hypothetical protein E7L40_01230 [Corynebacterium kroppenstedtii]|nr:hypothetical protein [Corynebacterium kroppenstedtii]MDU7286242.1 hypothetical protein [Corynebacterium kroppenstedtii]
MVSLRRTVVSYRLGEGTHAHMPLSSLGRSMPILHPHIHTHPANAPSTSA